MGRTAAEKAAQERYYKKLKQVKFSLTQGEQKEIKTDENYSRLAKRLFLDYFKKNIGGNGNE